MIGFDPCGEDAADCTLIGAVVVDKTILWVTEVMHRASSGHLDDEM
jgi:hypothetical protein